MCLVQSTKRGTVVLEMGCVGTLLYTTLRHYYIACIRTWEASPYHGLVSSMQSTAYTALAD